MSTAETLISLTVEDQIAYLKIDIQGESVNTLSPKMTDRMEEILAELKRAPRLEGAVVYSGKRDFIVGFDIKEFKHFADDPKGLRDLGERGHRLMNSFGELGIPFVAAINGNCLGGGLEVALACRARVASNHKSTKFGLPEVMLGLIPGAGGTQRLPQTVDLSVALDMILTGRQLDARKAKRAGLVDDVVHPDILVSVAAEMARKLHQEDQEKGTPLTELVRAPVSGAMKLVAATPARALIFKKAREQVMKRTHGEYPAPLAALEVIEHGLAHGFEAGLAAELDAFIKLVQSDVSASLRGIFFMKQDADKDPVVSRRTKSVDVRKIGVLGAGLMGAGIAQLAAYQGYNVRMKDRDARGLGWGLDYCNGLFQKMATRKKIAFPEADMAMGRISGTTDYSGFGTCDVVIEAVFEDLSLKQEVLADIEALGKKGLIFATNTSTLPIAEIAAKAKYPQNVVGMHFFSPVHKMPLLEIIRTKRTSAKAIATALAVGRKMGKTCIVVEDGPGFFTSRVVGAYINEAGWILQEGGSVEAIDQTMERFGFPVGPLKLIDEVGLDVAQKAAGILGKAFGHRWDQPTALSSIADEGRKGRKNHQGFYLYGVEDKGVDQTVYFTLPGGTQRRDPEAAVIRDRIWLAMLNECAYCLQEGILDKPRDIDIGVIFGLGFPPFRGGILKYADTVGIQLCVDTLNRLADSYGERLRPAQILVDMADWDKTFYPKP